jgi:hypothetical protein
MEQWRWIEISNYIMAYSVIGKVKVDPVEVFFGSLCVCSDSPGWERLSSHSFLSLFFSLFLSFYFFCFIFGFDVVYTLWQRTEIPF